VGSATDPDDFGRKMSALLDAQKDLVPAETAIRNSFGMSPANFDLLVRSFLKAEIRNPGARDRTPAIPRPAHGPRAAGARVTRSARGNDDGDRNTTWSASMKSSQPWIAPRRDLRSHTRVAHAAGGAPWRRRRARPTRPRLRAGSDPRLLRGAGLALFERALAAQADARPDQAFVLLGLATSAHPDDAEARVGLLQRWPPA
jgi:hypothetical protein